MNAIVYCCDDNKNNQDYLQYSIRTLRTYDKSTDIFVLTYPYILIDIKDCNIKYITLKDDEHIRLFESIKSSKRPEISKTTFLRLFIPLITQLSVYDKILYMDTDTEIIGDISDIFSNESYGYYEIYGRNELDENTNIKFKEYQNRVLSIPDNKLYKVIWNDCWVNAGVLLINMKKVSSGYHEKLVRMIQCQNMYDFNNKDEDIINMFFHIGRFQEGFNQFPNEKCQDAKIVHYICHYKTQLREKISHVR